MSGADPQKAQLKALNAELGIKTARADVARTMGARSAVEELTDPKVAACLMSTVKEPDARYAHFALVDLTHAAAAAKLRADATPLPPPLPSTSSGLRRICF